MAAIEDGDDKVDIAGLQRAYDHVASFAPRGASSEAATKLAIQLAEARKDRDESLPLKVLIARAFLISAGLFGVELFLKLRLLV